MIEQGAAGEPAARLAAHVFAEAIQLDQHRRRLAAEHEELADVLLDIERSALRHFQREVQVGLATAASPTDPPVVRKRWWRCLGGRVPKWRPRRHRRPSLVVRGFVVPDASDAPESEELADDNEED